MSKNSAKFQCNNCDTVFSKWTGQCSSCQEWNTVSQVTKTSSPVALKARSGTVTPMQSLAQIQLQPTQRMISGIQEWDRICGGGIMPGSFMMLTGDPGIGKSTLMLQIAGRLAEHYRVFYFSSEESLEQVKLRADRLACWHDNLLFSDNAQLDDIIATAEQEQPDIIIIDSIQNCYSSSTSALPGSINQIKESTFKIMRLAKEKNIATLVSGHITKEGSMAGPKTLEHMVDAVFYLQSEDRWQTRILRSVKNRFGTINDLGFFEMSSIGLQEVKNINQSLLQEASQNPGSALSSYTEGSRSLLIELQALTITSNYGIPQRVITGIDQKQVVLIAAILEKCLGIKLNAHDIFFKVSGGIKIKGSATDLGIALALLSSFFQTPLPQKSLALGEISLTGNIKPINHAIPHIQEAEKFGINQLFLSRHQKINTSCKTTTFTTISELLTLFE